MKAIKILEKKQKQIEAFLLVIADQWISYIEKIDIKSPLWEEFKKRDRVALYSHPFSFLTIKKEEGLIAIGVTESNIVGKSISAGFVHHNTLSYVCISKVLNPDFVSQYIEKSNKIHLLIEKKQTEELYDILLDAVLQLPDITPQMKSLRMLPSSLLQSVIHLYKRSWEIVLQKNDDGILVSKQPKIPCIGNEYYLQLCQETNKTYKLRFGKYEEENFIAFSLGNEELYIFAQNCLKLCKHNFNNKIKSLLLEDLNHSGIRVVFFFGLQFFAKKLDIRYVTDLRVTG